MRRLILLIAVLLAGCGTPVPPSAVPVLRDVTREDVVRLHDAGYETIGLAQLIAFLRGEDVALPSRPVVLTFDHGRRDTRTDALLRELGYRAVVFVDVGRVSDETPGYLRWNELDALQRSG